ncbi:MAG: zinc ABC transporter substrate-binding protein [Candidatus Nanopelagicales bacterium]
MSTTKKRSRFVVTAAAIAAAGALTLTACGSNNSSEPAANDTANCPTTPINVVVTTNVWGSITDQLAGSCAKVATIITSPSSDPHDFEPTSQTSDTFANADLAIINGLGYDEWANKILNSLGSNAPQTINLGQDVGLKVGDNPHIWYSPTYVQESAKNITKGLKGKNESAASYFDDQAKSFDTAIKPYLDEVNTIKSQHAGTKISATESVFDYMAEATGLDLITPAAFMNAIANDSDPSTQAVQEFRNQLNAKEPKAFIFNTQTDGGLPTQLKALAEKNNIPIVNVTETLTPEGATFQQWQLTQLQALNKALGS